MERDQIDQAETQYAHLIEALIARVHEHLLDQNYSEFKTVIESLIDNWRSKKIYQLNEDTDMDVLIGLMTHKNASGMNLLEQSFYYLFESENE